MFWMLISRKWVGNACYSAILIVGNYPLLFLSSTESVFKPGFLTNYVLASYEWIMNQINWNNKYILSGGIPFLSQFSIN